MKRMRVIVKAPGLPGEIREIDDSLETIREIVGGYVEQREFLIDIPGAPFAVVTILADEDGKMKGQELNLSIPPHPYVGTVIFCKTRRSKFVGLEQADAEMLLLALDP